MTENFNITTVSKKLDEAGHTVGRNNLGVNTPEEIAAAKKRILARIRAQAPGAETLVVAD